jgi:asparagine synthase (glutamine-hydrolysing)
VERWRPSPFSASGELAPVEVREAEHVLDRSVSRHLVADVPVGVFLSSGVDSSLVLDSAVRSGARPTAYTIGFPGHGDFDEVRSAARFAAQLGVPHVVGELSGGFADTIGLISAAFDQPLADASAIAMIQLAKLARAQITVALSGTGGDDLFAGYYRHRAHLFSWLFGHLPGSVARRLAEAPGRRGGERRSLLALLRSYASRFAALEGRGRFDQYLELVASATTPRGIEATRGAGRLTTARDRFSDRLRSAEPGADSVLRQIQAFELATYLPGDLLVKEDRATMAVGLEARVPLLGIELLHLAERTPDRQKIGPFGGKRLLREIARRRLPQYLARTRKRGFAVPLADLFAGRWRAESIEWFADSDSSLVNGRLTAQLLRYDQMAATDAWALAALIGWERSVSGSRTQARSAGPVQIQQR